MNFSKEIIYSDLSTSKWLYNIEKVFCPRTNTNRFNNLQYQTKFLEALQENIIDFLSCFTEIIGVSTKKAKTALLQVILTSNKIHSYFLKICRIKIALDNDNGIRKNYLQMLSILESLLDDCEKLNDKLLQELPLTTFSSFIRKGEFKRKLEILNTKVIKYCVESDFVKLIFSGLRRVIETAEIKRGEMKYALIIFEKLLKLENFSSQMIEDLLIQYDFNSPKFFNYCAKHCNKLIVDSPGLHNQLERLITLEDRINSLPQICSWRLTLDDESIREQLKTFYKEKKENIKQRIDLRRTEILDSRLYEENKKMQINLPVSQIGLFIRLFMEQGIIPKEDVGKTFSYYAKHFRTPNTPFISPESLQKKSTDVEFATARKMKGHLIEMVNWLNERYNTSNYRDS